MLSGVSECVALISVSFCSYAAYFDQWVTLFHYIQMKTT